MKFINDEILFTGREEAETYLDILQKDYGMLLYTCNKCGINFATADPYTSDSGVICRVCMKALNLHVDDNYRPDYYDDPEEDIPLEINMGNIFDPYDDNKSYDSRGDEEWL